MEAGLTIEPMGAGGDGRGIQNNLMQMLTIAEGKKRIKELKANLSAAKFAVNKEFFQDASAVIHPFAANGSDDLAIFLCNPKTAMRF